MAFIVFNDNMSAKLQPLELILLYLLDKIICSADLAIDGEISNFEMSVRFFTINPDNDVCTFTKKQKKNIKNIMRAIY